VIALFRNFPCFKIFNLWFEIILKFLRQYSKLIHVVKYLNPIDWKIYSDENPAVRTKVSKVEVKHPALDLQQKINIPPVEPIINLKEVNNNN